MLKILPLGGGNEIGASSYLVQINRFNLLLDAGLRPRDFKNTPQYVRMFELIEDWSQIDAVFISHPHLDHVGSLPKVFEANPNVPIFVPEHSVPLIKVQIYESLTYQKRTKKYAEDYLGVEYSIELVSKCLSNLKTVPYNKLTKIKRSNIAFEFWPAGHILGSASVFIKSRKGSLLYTGDISTYEKMSIPNLSYPSRKVDLLIMESTYLSSNHEVSPQEGFDLLYSKVSEIVEKGNHVLIPCFALGKAQDITKMFVERNKLEDNPVPVYLDGLVKRITRIYNDVLGDSLFLSLKDGSCNLISGIPNDAEQYKKFLERNPGIVVISSSGMLLDGSKSARWAEAILPYEGNGLFFTGYLDEESPGARLLKCVSDKEINLNGENIPLNAQIDRFYISTHSSGSELANLVQKVNPKVIVLVHGNNPAQKVAEFQRVCEGKLTRKLPVIKSVNEKIIELGELFE
jgi:Cft2 family RNA processing exonuclease